MGRPRRNGTGGNPPSITNVAERAGVSIATVSRIVNGVANKAGPDTVARVQRAIAELGYRPVSVGRALRSGESRLVALLAANLGNPAMAAIAASAETALREAGAVMVLCDTHDSPALQDEYLLEMRAQFVRGIVLLGAVPSPQLAACRAAGDPLVFVGRRPPDGPPAAFVGIDNAGAGREVADHFLARGMRDLALIHGPLQSSATLDRITAFRTRLAAAGAPLPAGRIATGDGIDHLAIGHTAMDRLIAAGTRPAGVFCSSDLIAYGAHRRLREAGIDVPADVVLVGFDDNPLNDWVAPWLTSVQVPYRAFGAAIVEALAALSAGGTALRTILPHHFVVRGPAGVA